jgi:cephalosporin hydroxylase
MSVKRFWELDGCDENHEGGWGQQSIEVSLKAWLSGGKLVVNKKTWFAHWFRGSDGGFPYEIKESQIERVRQYSKDLWLNDKWPKATRKLQWLIEKFNPPGWNMDNEEFLYNWVFKGKNRFPYWRGNRMLKYPTDIVLYEQVIWETKPDFIIECGTAYGGATLFLADMCEICGNGKVISIDRRPIGTPNHPRITYITGRTTADDVLGKVRGMISGKVMVILDSDHRRAHVKRELHFYSEMVTPGQYMVVEDAWYKGLPHGPAEAIQWFMKTTRGKRFELTKIDDQFRSCLTRGGWLKHR